MTSASGCLLGFCEVTKVEPDLNLNQDLELALQLLLGFRSGRVGLDLEPTQLGLLLPLDSVTEQRLQPSLFPLVFFSDDTGWAATEGGSDGEDGSGRRRWASGSGRREWQPSLAMEFSPSPT